MRPCQTATPMIRAEDFSYQGTRALEGRLARLGRIHTPHGDIQTPEFLPVGTLATVKAMTPRDLEGLGVQGVLANTYHLYLRPGAERVQRFGGLHKFMGWNRPIMTDSGGFQAFSLGAAREHGVGKIGGIFPEEGKPEVARTKSGEKLAHIDEEGVSFRSHIDGSRHKLTPESSIAIQEQLGADMILAFDECTSPLAGYEYTELAMERTHRWAVRSLEARTNPAQALYGIVQGGEWEDLRARSVRFIADLPFDGFAVGGSLGKSKADMHRVLEWTVPHLPEDRPRHLLGIGEVSDLFEGVERGIDTFDCVLPTRFARTGHLLVPPETEGIGRRGTINLRHVRFTDDQGPVMQDCTCYTCRNFTRGYLRHLYIGEELLAYHLGSLHNLHFLLDLMRSIRAALANQTFLALKERWLAKPGQTEEDSIEN